MKIFVKRFRKSLNVFLLILLGVSSSFAKPPTSTDSRVVDIGAGTGLLKIGKFIPMTDADFTESIEPTGGRAVTSAVRAETTIGKNLVPWIKRTIIAHFKAGFVPLEVLEELVNGIAEEGDEKYRARALSEFLESLNLKDLNESLGSRRTNLYKSILSLIRGIKDKDSHWNCKMAYYESVDFSASAVVKIIELLKEATDLDQLSRSSTYLVQYFERLSPEQRTAFLNTLRDRFENSRSARIEGEIVLLLGFYGKSNLMSPSTQEELAHVFDQLLGSLVKAQGLQSNAMALINALTYLSSHQDSAQSGSLYQSRAILTQVCAVMTQLRAVGEFAEDSDEDSDQDSDESHKTDFISDLLLSLSHVVLVYPPELQAVLVPFINGVKSETTRMKIVEGLLLHGRSLTQKAVSKIFGTVSFLEETVQDVTRKEISIETLSLLLPIFQIALLNRSCTAQMATRVTQWMVLLVSAVKGDEASLGRSAKDFEDLIFPVLNAILKSKAPFSLSDLKELGKVAEIVIKTIPKKELILSLIKDRLEEVLPQSCCTIS